MGKFELTSEQIAAYVRYLKQEERTPATLEKYLRDVRAFALWLDGEAVTKEVVTCWKERLLAEHRAPSTVNAALSAQRPVSFSRMGGLPGAVCQGAAAAVPGPDP